MTAPVFQILPTTQKYDWGKLGLTSKVAQFAEAAKAPGFQLDEKSPYAEVSAVYMHKWTVANGIESECHANSFGWGRTPVHLLACSMVHHSKTS